MNQIVGVSIALWAAASVHAQEIAPNANLRAEGIPPIPAALARQAALYTEFRPRSVVSWHPARHELLVATRATNTTQLHHVRRPLGELTQATDYAEPVRSGLWLPAKPDVAVFARAAGGWTTQAWHRAAQFFARWPRPVPSHGPRRRVPARGVSRPADGKPRCFRPGRCGRRGARALARRAHAGAGHERGRRGRAAPLRRGHAPRACAPAAADRHGAWGAVAPRFRRPGVQPELGAEPGRRLRARFRRSPGDALDRIESRGP